MDDLGIDLKAGVAGFLGAVVSLRFLRDLTLGQMILASVGGFISAGYLTQAIVHWFGFPLAYFGGVAFVVGLFGQSLAGAIILAIRNADLWGIAKGWLEKKDK